MKRVLPYFMLCGALILGSCVKGNNHSSEKMEEDTVAVVPDLDMTDFNEEKDEDPVNIDSVAIKRLLPKFEVKKDEFDPNEAIWYIPKNAPKYVNKNGLYVYFKEDKDGLGPLRFRLQYYADNWLFIKKVQFSIDGKAYEFIPYQPQTDFGDGMIWEWFDDAIIGASDKELIKALASASSARMKLIGKQYHNIKSITSAQLESIKNTVELYKAMGGRF